jgi:hypothetical protein
MARRRKKPTSVSSADIEAAIRARFARWGAEGGKTRAERLTPARRREIARQAVAAREQRRRSRQ